MIDIETNFLEVAKEAVLEAGAIVESFRGKTLSVSHKESKASPVTQADTLSQRAILRRIRANFKDFNILAEEGKGEINKGSRYTVVFDPLDGTTCLINNLPFYTVGMTLLIDFEPTVGVVYRPAGHELYWGVKNQGAYKQTREETRRIHVSGVEDPEQALVGTGLQNKDPQREVNRKIYDVLSRSFLMPPNELAAIHSTMRVAEGQYGGYVHLCRPWDFTAGAVIVTEAGGKVTDWQGNPINWSKIWSKDWYIEAIFSNGLIHPQIVKSVKKCLR